MRVLLVSAAVTLGIGCAQVQTRTHFDRWAARSEEAPEEAAPPPAAAPPRAARPVSEPARPRYDASARDPALPEGETPPVDDVRRGDANRSRALRPVENDEDDEEAIY